MKTEILNKFVEIFGDKINNRFDLLKDFKRLELYKIETKNNNSWRF